ncbi:DNA replication protein [Naganishia albida]|nr:DNA replication protein [Naganishia albida]
MEDDYYSINAILADNHKLSCTFTLDVAGIGFLEGGNERDIKQYAKAELPFWMAERLSFHGFTTFPIPAPYSPRVRSALNASPISVALSGLVGAQGWWYTFGSRIFGLLEERQGREGREVLRRAFIHRLPVLQDLATHYGASAAIDSGGGSGSGNGSGSGLVAGEAFMEGMDAEERELFAIGQDGERKIKVWYDTPLGRLKSYSGR